MDSTSLIKDLLPILTLLGQVLSVLFLFFLANKSLRNAFFGLFENVNRKFVFWSLVVSLIATLGSLFYSEVAGFDPCKLCWFQRILMYPQVIILATGLWREESVVLNYVIPLSGLGLLTSGYHYLLQIGLLPQPPCSTVGFSISCSQNFFMHFGYITIPLMAFTAFLLIFIFSLGSKTIK